MVALASARGIAGSSEDVLSASIEQQLGGHGQILNVNVWTRGYGSVVAQEGAAFASNVSTVVVLSNYDNTPIVLDFDMFVLEPGVGMVEVFDGDSDRAPWLATLSGTVTAPSATRVSSTAGRCRSSESQAYKYNIM